MSSWAQKEKQTVPLHFVRLVSVNRAAEPYGTLQLLIQTFAGYGTRALGLEFLSQSETARGVMFDRSDLAWRLSLP